MTHVAQEQDSILDRVDGSVGLIGGRNGDTTTVIELFPLVLVRQRKDVSGFKASEVVKMG